MPEPLLRTYLECDGLALADLVRTKQVAPQELVEIAIGLIESLNPTLNAVVHKLYDTARAAASHTDHSSPFAGVPYLLKEGGTMWQGAPMTIASSWMRNLTAPCDEEVVRRMKKAGFVLVGKSNAPENGWSLTTEPRLYGATCNPWDHRLSPGGSSGGSAAAVAAYMVPLAEASDGAGSIRVPASCCGTVGLKPSRGRVTASPAGDPWNGCAYEGCVTRTIRDTAAYLDAIAGVLPGDPYCSPTSEATWLALSQTPPSRLRVGFSLAPPGGGVVHPDCSDGVRAGLAVLESQGHLVEEYDLGTEVAEIWPAYTRMTCVQTALFFDALAGTVGRPVTANDVEEVTWAVIERGRSETALRYAADVERIRRLGRDISIALDEFDVFVTPTLTHPPRPLGHLRMSEPDLDRYNSMWGDAAFMYPFNISGQPAISLPLHWSAEGLPIGVQFVGRHGDEGLLLAVATVLEAELPWRDRLPPCTASAAARPI